MSAKFFIYRNLHHGAAFSIRYKGLVIDRLQDFVAHNVTFKVSEAGRNRTLAGRHKNVHAFVVAEIYSPIEIDVRGLTRVSYNPFLANTFRVLNESIHEAESVVFSNGKCYLI